MAGRVYDIDADESKGEIRVEPGTVRCFITINGKGWQRFPWARRIEFERDADSGPAVVEAAYVIDEKPMLAPAGDEVATVRFRVHAKIEHMPAEELPDHVTLQGQAA